MATDNGEFLLGDGNDDMAKDDTSEGQRPGQPAATGLARPIGDFQCACGPRGTASKNQWDYGDDQANCGTGQCPKQFGNLEPRHCSGA
jgi:hypothetical protein